MSVFQVLLSVTLLLTSAVPALAGEALFQFKQLRGVPTPPVTIRNIPGGGAPWTIAQGEARLDEDGTLKVEVEGLVLAAGPSAGTNPVGQFFATLSCLNADGTINNINTSTVPATSTGDATIEEVLALTATCLGPIVLVRADLASIPGFVGNPAGPDPNDRWLAVSGF